jgi:SAM-dependent methyltransferase
MAQFSKHTFKAANYAAFRPQYPQKVFDTVNAYHQGERNLVVDLGCGPGTATRPLSRYFKQAVGTDPSPGMIKTARDETDSSFKNIKYRQASAEKLDFLKDGETDMLFAGQAAHWFDLDLVWKEFKRVLRPGGTIAFVGYKDHAFVDYPKATKLLDLYSYGSGDKYFGDCWEQPGRSRLRNLLRDLRIEDEWGFEDVDRIEYEPGSYGPGTGEGDVVLGQRMSLGFMEDYLRTWSSVNKWIETHPEQVRKLDGGKGDVVDNFFEELVEGEPDFKNADGGWQKKEVEVEWGSVILLARAKTPSLLAGVLSETAETIVQMSRS